MSRSLLSWVLDRRVAKPGRACVTFCSTRTAFEKVALDGVGLERLPKSRDVWSGQIPAPSTKRLVVEVHYDGEPPELSNVHVVPTDEQAGTDQQRQEIESTDEKEYRRLLETRAARRFSEHASERRFFIRFDAWTTPTIMKLLRDEGFKERLADPAKELFAGKDAPKFPLDDPDALVGIATALMNGAIGRAKGLLLGQRCVPAPPGDEKEHPTPAESHAEARDMVIDYVASIFWKGVPGGSRDESGNTISEERFDFLERAFALFASGALAFVPKGDSDVRRSELNAEPDSNYFFLFAELALIASESERPDKWTWFRLARLFVALQDVFIAKYGGALAKPNAPNYLRKHRASGRPIPLEEIRAHLLLFEDRFKAERDLESSVNRLAVVHEIAVLHAIRDEATKGFAPGRRDGVKKRADALLERARDPE